MFAKQKLLPAFALLFAVSAVSLNGVSSVVAQTTDLTTVKPESAQAIRNCTGGVEDREDVVSNAATFPSWAPSADSQLTNLASQQSGGVFGFFQIFATSCTRLSGGQVIAYREDNPSIRYSMSPAKTAPLVLHPSCRGTNSAYPYCYVGYWVLDITTLEPGTYRWQSGGFVDEYGVVSGMSDTTRGVLDSNGRLSWIPATFKVSGGTSTTTSTTVAPRQADKPEVLSDDLTLVVDVPNQSARAYYSAVVRCSNRCGKLPDVFQARLCEVGTSYRSSSCLASTSMSPLGSKKKVTKTSTTNMFFGGFLFKKAPTGKTYRVYLNIPAGRNHAPVSGKDTFAWTRRTANPPTTTTTPASTTTTLPGSATTTTTVTPSNLPVAIVADSVAGIKFATVQGANTSIFVEVTVSCSGKCTALPSYIAARLCKAGTSYLDASCTTAQSIVRASGSLNSTYFGQLRLGFDPTGLTYQPFFSVLATGLSGYVRSGGTSRVTWSK